MITIDLAEISKLNGKSEVECSKLIGEVLMMRSQIWGEKITLLERGRKMTTKLLRELIIEFKTVSPLFEMERDGVKPFTSRNLDFDDERRTMLFDWYYARKNVAKQVVPLLIRIINPATNESFTRQVKHVDEIRFNTGWLNIVLALWK